MRVRRLVCLASGFELSALSACNDSDAGAESGSSEANPAGSPPDADAESTSTSPGERRWKAALIRGLSAMGCILPGYDPASLDHRDTSNGAGEPLD